MQLKPSEDLADMPAVFKWSENWSCSEWTKGNLEPCSFRRKLQKDRVQYKIRNF